MSPFLPPVALRTAFIIIALTGVLSAAGAPPPAEPPFSWDDFVMMVKAGGVTMYPLGLLSLAALAYSIERAMRLRRARLVPHGLGDACRAAWAAGDYAKVDAIAKESGSALGKAIRIMVTYRDKPKEDVQSSAAEIASAELLPHIRACKPLIIIATTAPLLGLFGTILGMIGAFRKFQHLGASGDPGVFAHNISEALVTAATGLIIAAYALFLYHTFKNRALRFGDQLEAEINTLAMEWFLARTGGSAEAPRQG